MNRLTKLLFHSAGNLFTYADLSVLLEGSDHSRHGLVKRALAAGEILRLRRGLYCLAPEYQKKTCIWFYYLQQTPA
ncbi:MAG: type IV toxin-antitoxin system AbiEi family antitoxin domain-containing protein [Lentisphaerae bacterium]|jgi:hypothetical protein|nr:type IV toxin-antitoxin system AbiEi family antitoxin domain-containing protein [Lentisphaerota bacterium]